MKKTLFVILSFFLLVSAAEVCAQAKWDLRRCVEYATANNINVKQADVQAKLSALTLHQSKLERWPNANFQNSEGFQFGRSIDPATNGFTNQQISFSQFGLSSNVTPVSYTHLTLPTNREV